MVTPRWGWWSRTPRNSCAPCRRGATYGLLRYLNPGVDWVGGGSGIGFNYLGRLGAGAGELSEEMWRIGEGSLELSAAATAIDMPLMHTVELNAGTLDTDAGPATAGVVDLGALGGGC